ncbi:MAG: hypothetical protein O7C60_05945 [Rickettsia endosymbiont of Ixodes persulcatus]|nr:hypothetical protein [Rickettsia endosymbiont of Ixodes persulcatus]
MSVSFVGKIRKLIRPYPLGESLLILGTPGQTSLGRIQTWESPQRDDDDDLPMETKEESVMNLDGFGEKEEGKKKRIANWLGGRMVVVGEGSRLSIYSRDLSGKEGMRLMCRKEEETDVVDFNEAKSFFVARRSEDDLNVWIIAVTKSLRTGEGKVEGKGKEGREWDYSLKSWIYYSPSKSIFPGAPSIPLSSSSSSSGGGDEETSISWVSIVPPSTTKRSGELSGIQVQSIDTKGGVRTWRLDLNDEEPAWKGGRTMETGIAGARRCASKGNGVIAIGTFQTISRITSALRTDASLVTLRSYG